MTQQTISCWESRLVWLAAFTLLLAATLSFAQEPVSPTIDSNPDVESWTGGTIDDALSQSASGATIPMSAYVTLGSDGAVYTGVLVGGDPSGGANTKPATIDAVLIPLIIQIIKPDGEVVLFDPTAPDYICDKGFSPEYRFQHSPLVVPSDLTFNGVSVGNVQYIDGFMRAEFWNDPNLNRSSYFNRLNWSFASAFTLPPLLSSVAIVSEDSTGVCSERGIVSQSFFGSFMNSGVIPLLQSTGVISPTKFAFFLTKNVVTSNHTPPTTSSIKGGQHYVTGSPAQTWARASYPNTGSDVRTASHEIAEWMNDPLLTNVTPPWGYIGSLPNGCSNQFEVGDPLNSINSLPLIYMSGHRYHVQELAFFSWFFDFPGTTSVGAGGKYSSNGTFSEPSLGCPSGGT